MSKLILLILLTSVQAGGVTMTSLRCVEGQSWVEFQHHGGKEYTARVHRPSGSETIEYLACDVSVSPQGTLTIMDCAQSRLDWSRKRKGIYVQINNDGATYKSSQYIITGLGVGLNGMIPDNIYRPVGEKMSCEKR